MNFSLRQISAPAIEPITLEEALEQCHADSGVEDAWFTRRIRSGRIKAEEYLRRSLITQTWELSLDCFPEMILLPRSPVQSVTSIKYYDVQNTEYTLDLNTVIVDTDSQPARITLAYGRVWPSTTLREINAVKIEYVAGYGDTAGSIPETFKDAILLYVSHSYGNREGETELTKAFYDLLRPSRLYL